MKLSNAYGMKPKAELIKTEASAGAEIISIRLMRVRGPVGGCIKPVWVPLEARQAHFRHWLMIFNPPGERRGYMRFKFFLINDLSD